MDSPLAKAGDLSYVLSRLWVCSASGHVRVLSLHVQSLGGRSGTEGSLKCSEPKWSPQLVHPSCSCGRSVASCKTVTSGQKRLPQKDCTVLGYAQQQQHNPAHHLAFLRCLLQSGAQPGRTKAEEKSLWQMASTLGLLRLGDLLQVWPGRRVQAEMGTLSK